jgi:Protein of unknown function (DUF2505)
MPRQFGTSFEAAVTVAQAHSAFGDEDYWLARIAAFGAVVTIDSLLKGPGGVVTVATTQDLRRAALPAPLAKVCPADLTIRRCECWTPIDDGTLAGDIDITATGAPLSGGATALLASADGGSRLTISGSLAFTFPVVGGRVENYLVGQLLEGIAEIMRFTDRWIAERSADRSLP